MTFIASSLAEEDQSCEFPVEAKCILNTWDKTGNGRNLQKVLKLPTAPTCPLCTLTEDTQAHLMLRRTHPVITVAREGF